ncbi:MarR family winged helix-turn-helix transcriptional regulator [Parvibacter caecicola]|uniref:MarR family winged helix-turn-helix transcriptional regulator n=1 Tax=Parvibacter caecicola TaxID=747645 RepID=UPI002499B026|nr:MarR family winged helix-turn-helix transcriptional regulator [Parvibacter caecicola]
MAAPTPISNLITGTVMFNRMIQEIIAGQTPFTLTQYRILFYLQICADDARRIRDIAHVLSLSTSTVSDAASELEQAQLVCKFEMPSDLKAVGLQITGEGLEQLTAAQEAVVQGSQFYWDILGEETQESFFTAIQLLADIRQLDAEKVLGIPRGAAYPFVSRTHLARYTSWFKSTYNLSLVDVRILFLLLETGAPMRISDISHLLNEPASTVSSATRSLYRVRKVVERERKPSNKRETIISLNDSGRALAQEIMDRFVSWCCHELHQTREEFERETLGRTHARAIPTAQDRIFGEKLESW